MWNEAAALIKPELSAHEQLLWAGQPRGGIVFRWSDAYSIPCSLLWTGFACFWEYSALRTEAPLIMKLWGIPFILIGLQMTVGRFFVEASKRARTFYGITSERVILISGFSSRKLTSVNLRTLSDITLNQRSDGSGDINLGEPARSSSWFLNFGNRQSEDERPSLELIGDVRSVYDLLRDAHTKAQYDR